jgi:hypothetical protein
MSLLVCRSIPIVVRLDILSVFPMNYNYFMENHNIKSLIISNNTLKPIESVITACFYNTLKPKALIRRARGKNRTCPVLSCLIQPDKRCGVAALFSDECGAFLQGYGMNTIFIYSH